MTSDRNAALASDCTIPTTSAFAVDVTKTEAITTMSLSTTAPAKTPDETPRLRCRSDFLFLEELGEGSFSTVFLASERETSRKFAVKVCFKAQIMREKKVAQIFREKEILRMLSTPENAHPFIVRLFCTFQDRDSLYFVLTLAPRKDLLRLLQKLKRFDAPQTRFIASELLSAMDHIHNLKIVHRDLKPENILLNEDGHILVSDFGCAKQFVSIDSEPFTSTADESNPSSPNSDDGDEPEGKIKRSLKRRSSFVGTSFYVSPEVLNGDEVDEACDYWTLGVIIFEMLSGRRPFSDVSEYLIYQRILKLLYRFDDGFPPTEETAGADELIRRLLVVDRCQRWGSRASGGCERVKAHPFFDGVDWLNLTKVKSPLL